ncbi:S-methyl-5-thioribose-1-phosphate isomerase [[Eubacterium] cellulosolvens]
MNDFFELRSVKWKSGKVVMIDQTKIPDKLTYVSSRTYMDVANAIKTMVVRGAPAIGVAAAMGLGLVALHSKAKTKEIFLKELESAASKLAATRPTAVNLSWALKEIIEVAKKSSDDTGKIKDVIIRKAIQMAEDDVMANLRIGEYGEPLIADEDTVLTHCNAGALATVGYGTALAPIRTSVKQGKQINVIASETRPRLQGARLTAFELSRDRIPVRIITDNMIGHFMHKGMVDKVIVGADRIVNDGVFNKIGTYTLAITSRYHKIPFYVAAPISTFDLLNSSDNVIIEERSTRELTHISNKRIYPKNVDAMNPAFDFTPFDLVDGIITDRGVINKPVRDKILEFNKK